MRNCRRYALFLLALAGLLPACKTMRIAAPARHSQTGGSAFYARAAAMNWAARDSFAVAELLEGNMPSFLLKFSRIDLLYRDSVTGKTIRARAFVAPDYLSVGTDADWARLCISPMAAQRIADTLHCFLTTRKLADDIYRQAKVKLDPVPMYAFRDSTPTMWQHHLIIEGQRKGRKGLIAGIKKDVVISGKVTRDTKPNRVAIYGWHKMDGRPIQPLYTGHVNWYVDYSQGIRLVYRKLKVNGKWMDYTDIMKDPVLQRLLCDEAWCDFTRYAY